MSAFDDAMAFNWRPENDGQGFHDDPRDPGGATSWGVTFATWTAWQALHRAPADLETFRALPATAFLPLYHTLFWTAVQGDSLPPGVSLSVFDAAVGSAPAHAARFLQAVVGTVQDGMIGPVTLAAARALVPAQVITCLCEEREAYYARLPTFRIYGRGWNRRAEDCQKLALTIAGGGSATA